MGNQCATTVTVADDRENGIGEVVVNWTVPVLQTSYILYFLQ